MFDSVTISPHTYVHERRDIHEHRAPTDQSVALLKEMETAAENKRFSSFRLEGNALRGVVEIAFSACDDTLRAVALFELNGTKHRVDVHVHGCDKRELVRELDGKISAYMSAQIITPSLQSILKA